MTQNPRKEATDSLGLANGDAMGMSNYDNAAGANRLGPLATQGFGVHGSGFSGNFAAEGPNPYATASASFNKADTASQSSVSNPMGLQSSPNPYAEKLAQQLAAFGKYAAQDSDKQQRSSTGEDNGVSFNTRDEDHATGTDAWASLGKYVKTAESGDLLKALAILTGVGGLGGAAIGGLGSSLGGGNVGRGMISGGLTGAGLGLGASSGGIAGSAGLAAARDAKLAPSEDGLVTALGSALPPAFGAGTGAYAGHQLAQHLLGEEDEDEKAAAARLPNRYYGAWNPVHKNRVWDTLFPYSKKKTLEDFAGKDKEDSGSDPSRWHYDGDDDGSDHEKWEYLAEDDERVQANRKRKEKQGNDELTPPEAAPAVHTEPTSGQKLKSKIEDNWPVAVGAGALGLGGYGLYNYLNSDEDDEEEKEAEFAKYAMQPADQKPRHDCNAVHPDSTHEEWIREEFSNPPTRDWEREKESSWWSGARKIASTHIPLDAVKLLKEAGYEPFPCAFFGDLLNSGVSAELIPAAVEKAAGLVGAEYVTELRDSVPGLLEKLAAGRWFTAPKTGKRFFRKNSMGNEQLGFDPGNPTKKGQIPTQLEISRSPELSFPTRPNNPTVLNAAAPVPDLAFPKSTAATPLVGVPDSPVGTGPLTRAQAAAQAAAPVAPVAPAAPAVPVVAKAVVPDSGIPSSPTPAKATVPDYGPDGKPIDPAARAAASANAVAPPPSVTPGPGGIPKKTLIGGAFTTGFAALWDPVGKFMDTMGMSSENSELIETFSSWSPEVQEQASEIVSNLTPDQITNISKNPKVFSLMASGNYEEAMKHIPPEQLAAIKDAAMGNWFEGLGSGEFGKTINEFTSLLGVDSLIDAVGMDSAGMNPLLKLLMVAGGALGIGGAVSGSKTAGIAGAAMFVLPLVFGALFGGAEAAVIKPPSEPDPAGMGTGPTSTGPSPRRPPVTAPAEVLDPTIPSEVKPAAPPTASPVVPPVASPVVPPVNEDNRDIQALTDGAF